MTSTLIHAYFFFLKYTSKEIPADMQLQRHNGLYMVEIALLHVIHSIVRGFNGCLRHLLSRNSAENARRQMRSHNFCVTVTQPVV